MSGNTPGPWTVEERDTRVEIFAGDVNIATVAWPVDDSEAEKVARADAHLIAAAPDLLAAVEALMSGKTEWKKACALADAAIAKARGGA